MRRSRRSTVAVYLLVALALVVFVFPIAWLFLTSIKPATLTFAYPPAFTFEPTLDHYAEVTRPGR